MNYLFNFNKRRSAFGALGFFFAHAVFFFVGSLAIIILLDKGLPVINKNITEEQLALIVNYSIRFLGAIYSMFMGYQIGKHFDRGPMMFAVVFSGGASLMVNVFMGFLLPVMMTTMIEDRSNK